MNETLHWIPNHHAWHCLEAKTDKAIYQLAFYQNEWTLTIIPREDRQHGKKYGLLTDLIQVAERYEAQEG